MPAEPAEPAEPADLEAITADLHDFLTRDPNACVALGVNRHLDELPDPTTAEGAARAREAEGLLERLDALDRAPLSFDETLDADLARHLLEAVVHRETLTYNGRTDRQQMPDAGDVIGYPLFLLLIVDPRPAADRLADITARIERVPDFLDAVLDTLETPVARWVEIDRIAVEGLPSLFGTLQQWAADQQWPDEGRLSAARERAERALTDYIRRLVALPTTAALHVGDEVARRVVAVRGIDMSLEELHRMAGEFLGRTRIEIEELRARLVDKYDLDGAATMEDLESYLGTRFAVVPPGGPAEPVLQRYEQERRRIDDFIAERRLFPIPADQDMRILNTPEFLVPTIPAGAMMQPAAFREGTRTSIVYLTLTPEQVAEHTELSIPGMMIHEGIPGHHLQLATASMHPSVVRRHVDAAEHGEGWTTMLEDYMLDQGYMGDLVDEARLDAKRGISRLGARVAIDLFFMTGDKGYLDVGVQCDLSPTDPFEAAGNLLRACTGFSAARARGELNWYSKERGYPLSYLTGNTLVWQLKRDIEAHGTPGLDLDREFHRIYLESGNMPVKHLRRVFEQAGMVG